MTQSECERCIGWILVSCVVVMAWGVTARGETIRNEHPAFTLELPEGFDAVPKDTAGIEAFDYMYLSKDVEGGESSFVVVINILDGMLARKSTVTKDAAVAAGMKLSKEVWQGFQIDVMEGVREANEVEVFGLSTIIPLRQRGIQLIVYGQSQEAAKVREILRRVLAGLHGESNWMKSALPSSISEKEWYGPALAVVGVGGAIVLIIVFWVMSRKSPKGVLLGLGVVIYIVRASIGDSNFQEMRMLSGSLAFLGAGCVLLGLIDLVLPRRKAADDKGADVHATKPDSADTVR